MGTAHQPQSDAAAAVGGERSPSGKGFVHLHLHSEYSLLDGGNRIDRLVARVKELGMDAVAVTDHGNLHGAIAFYHAARAAGIKPILGVEAYVAPGDRRDRTYTGVSDGGYHLVLLAENKTGWDNLLYLCSQAYLTGFYFKPRMDRALLEERNDGLIAINGHLGSEIGEHLLAYVSGGGSSGGERRVGEERHLERAVESAKWHASVFRDVGTGPRFFIELQHHVPEQIGINPELIRLARRLDLPLICDNDSHFLRAEDHDAHDTLICVSMGKFKADPNRLRYTPELYVKSPEQMWEIFGGQEYNGPEVRDAGREALANTVAVADRCNVELPKGQSHAPVVRVKLPETTPDRNDPRFGGDLSAWHRAYCDGFEVEPFDAAAEGRDAEQVARRQCDHALGLLCEAGMVWRYGEEVLAHRDRSAAPGDQSDPSHMRDLWARLRRELNILSDKEIAAYFLIVWDFVNWGRQRGIPAMARGSGVGTMVGYVLGLSNACPVRYGLLFERFTDPDRKEYPDIDVDLCQDGRGAVIDYVRRKYGHVAQIITFGTLKAKAVVRDVARVLEFPRADADRLAKLIPEQLGMTLDQALEEEPALRKWYDEDPVVKRIIDTGKVLEGQARHASVHAAGVIVATRPLHEIVPLYKQAGAAEHEVVTQWDGPTCEKLGLLKMDFLGLRTLSVIERCKTLIARSMPEEAIWAAAGRGGEYQKWQSGRVPQWQSEKPDGAIDGAGQDTDVSRPDRMATGDGPCQSHLSRDGRYATNRDVRTYEPDAAGGDLYSDEHRRGIREALPPGVHPRPASGDGFALRADDVVRDRDHDGPDRGNQRDARGARGRGSPGAGADHEAGGEDTRRRIGSPAPPRAAIIHLATPSLCHSATLAPSGPHPLDLERLTYDDQAVFELFRRADTTGVFQFESGGMRRLLVEMQPDRLEDLIAANALFRPGPMDLIPDYNRRKHGQDAVPRIHEIVDRFTDETYGVMVYQEQVMQIVHELGGIPLRDAYTLIKAISKKNKDTIDKSRGTFVAESVKKGLSSGQAQDLFELILKFAGYGFNKSHSTGYAIVAYQTAYLKTYFPNHYMAAFLTYESQAQKVADWVPYLEDCKNTRFTDGHTGVDVRPPDVNLSDADFSVVYEPDEPRDALHGHVRFGLRAIKGAGEKAIDLITAVRDGRGGAATHGRNGKDPHPTPATTAPASAAEETPPPIDAGPFTSIYDFCERVLAAGSSPGGHSAGAGGSGGAGGAGGAGVVNRTTIEALIKSGAFDSIHERDKRAAMVETIETAVAAAQKAAADKAAGQASLFGGGDNPAAAAAAAAEPALAPASPWSEKETLDKELEVLGFYVSSHPLQAVRGWMLANGCVSVPQMKAMAHLTRVLVGGLISGVRKIVVRNGRTAGERMAIVTLDDQSGVVEAVLFPDDLKRYDHLVADGAAVFIIGKVDTSRGEAQLIADRVVPIDGCPLDPVRCVQVLFDESRLNGTMLKAMHAVRDMAGATAAAAETPAGVPVKVWVMADGLAAAHPIGVDPELRLPVTQEAVSRLTRLVGEGGVKLAGQLIAEREDKRAKWRSGGGGGTGGAKPGGRALARSG